MSNFDLINSNGSNYDTHRAVVICFQKHTSKNSENKRNQKQIIDYISEK